MVYLWFIYSSKPFSLPFVLSASRVGISFGEGQVLLSAYNRGFTPTTTGREVGLGVRRAGVTAACRQEPAGKQ